MTAIPEPTEGDLKELADLEDAYDWATGDGGNHLGNEEAAKFIRLLSHYQREVERLAREIRDLKSVTVPDWRPPCTACGGSGQVRNYDPNSSALMQICKSCSGRGLM